MNFPNDPLKFFDKKQRFIDPQGKKVRIFQPSRTLIGSAIVASMLFAGWVGVLVFERDQVFELRPKNGE